MLEAVSKGEADAVLAAGLFHYGTSTINEVKQMLNNYGIPIRTLQR